MVNCWPSSDQERIIPFLFSFIILRQERFGALVFNHYLGMEEELDPIEAYIVGLCNGCNSCRQIEITVQRYFSLSPLQSRKRIEDTMKKLLPLCALGFVKGDEDRPRLPDMAVFPDDAPYLSSPKNVIWDVTYACNLCCPHCLTNSGIPCENELDTKGALLIIDRLAEAKVFSLSLSGGEPLLRPDILTLLRHASNTNMRVEILTNGLVLPESMLEEIRDLPIFQVQVSIDGIGEQHDRFRGRKGAFDAACRTINRLQQEGIAVSISTTATHENVGTIDRIIDLALKLKCKGFKAIPFLSAGRGRKNTTRLKLSTEEHFRLCENLNKRKKQLQSQLTISTETTFSFLLERPPVEICSDGSMGCEAGNDILSIGADGTAYPCPFLHDFPLGSLVERPLKHLWEEAPILRILRNLQKQDLEEPCKNCRYSPHMCKGGCRAASYLEYADLRAADPNCFISVLCDQ